MLSTDTTALLQCNSSIQATTLWNAVSHVRHDSGQCVQREGSSPLSSHHLTIFHCVVVYRFRVRLVKLIMGSLFSLKLSRCRCANVYFRDCIIFIPYMYQVANSPSSPVCICARGCICRPLCAVCLHKIYCMLDAALFVWLSFTFVQTFSI